MASGSLEGRWLLGDPHGACSGAIAWFYKDAHAAALVGSTTLFAVEQVPDMTGRGFLEPWEQCAVGVEQASGEGFREPVSVDADDGSHVDAVDDDEDVAHCEGFDDSGESHRLFCGTANFQAASATASERSQFHNTFSEDHLTVQQLTAACVLESLSTFWGCRAFLLGPGQLVELCRAFALDASSGGGSSFEDCVARLEREAAGLARFSRWSEPLLPWSLVEHEHPSTEADECKRQGLTLPPGGWAALSGSSNATMSGQSGDDGEESAPDGNASLDNGDGEGDDDMLQSDPVR